MTTSEHNRIIFAPVKDKHMSVEHFDAIIRVNPCHAPAYLNRGFAYHQLGNYEKAINDYNEAIRLNPDYADAYHLRQLAQDGRRAAYERFKENRMHRRHPKDLIATGLKK